MFLMDVNVLVYAHREDVANHSAYRHVHLLVTPKTSKTISALFQGIGRHFVPYINKAYKRRGSLWEGRHKGCIIESEAYFLICMRYIEQIVI
jgi:hypothetical protein